MNRPPPVEAFIAHTMAALRSDEFIRLLLSSPVDHASPVERISGRLVELPESSSPGQANDTAARKADGPTGISPGRRVLSLTSKEARRDTVGNLEVDRVPAWLEQQLIHRFRSAVLATTRADWQLIVNSKGRVRLNSHAPASTTPPDRAHDRKKVHHLDASAVPWLTALGILDAKGKVRASMADKHRQLERYLEIVEHLVRDCGWQRGSKVELVDMGSGKGYLTFGVWHLLNHQLGLRANVIGVETRPELVAKTNAVARQIGAESLRFVQGDIASVALERIDGLIALHACNTATDQAIVRGVRAGARLIVVSPCCHQELRPLLGRPEPLAPLLGHGLFAERLSEWLTDGLRVLRLEEAGYETKVIEFVASEHTPRNLLIAGVRRPGASPDHGPRAAALKEFFHLGDIASDAIAPP